MEEEKQARYKCTSDLNRQYDQMENDLTTKNNELEKQQESLKEEISIFTQKRKKKIWKI